jgi:hypothetical protein
MLSNIIRIIKSRKMIWGLHVGHIKEGRNAYTFFVGRHERKGPLG